MRPTCVPRKVNVCVRRNGNCHRIFAAAVGPVHRNLGMVNMKVVESPADSRSNATVDFGYGKWTMNAVGAAEFAAVDEYMGPRTVKIVAAVL